HRLLRRTTRDQCAPIARLQLDVETQFSKRLHGEQRLRVYDGLVRGRDHDDLLALVARLLDELLGAIEVALTLQRLSAHFGRQRCTAGVVRVTGMSVFLVARYGKYVVLLIEDIEERLAQ